jgi:hypothetical protein
MHSLPSLAACFAVACVLFGCSSTSTPAPVADASVQDTSEDMSMDTSPGPTPEAGEAGPPSCVNTCPKGLTCCENGLSPNLGLCYNSTTNTMFCANEGGAP